MSIVKDTIYCLNAVVEIMKRVYSPELDMYFNSATQAAKFLNITVGTICSCCNRDPRHKHAGRHPETGELLTWVYV